MKFTKFIPAALALTLAFSPAFAEGEQGNRSLNDTFVIGVPEYFNISRVGTPVTDAGTVTVDTDMAGLSWDGEMGVTYKVVNNKHNKTFYVKATCPVTGNPKAFATALDSNTGTASDANSILIAFANLNATTAPQQAALTNAVSASPQPASNKNVFATTLNLAACTPTDGGTVVNRTVTNNEIVYTIHEGTYQFGYTFDQAAREGTFSPHDEMGTYKVTLTITDVASAG